MQHIARSIPKTLSNLQSHSKTLSFSTYSSHHNRRPKQKIYHREPLLDKAIELSKKPSLLQTLRNLIVSSKNHRIHLRDLEKHVGFVKKWNHFALIQRHPTIFRISGGENHAPISVQLSEKAKLVSSEEPAVRAQMEPMLIKNLRKLLMLSLDCIIPIEKIELIKSELGLPENFTLELLPKYPQFFGVKIVNGVECLCLESWDSSLAVTAREEKLGPGVVQVRSKVVPRDGNLVGPFAFTIKFPAGFRPNKHYLEEMVRWQRMAFPSPYLNARKVEAGTLQARKRAVAVLHEMLSLTMEKRMMSDKLDAFHSEFRLPSKLLLCLVKNHGIFYITNKGVRSTVFLKEAYDGHNLIEKCPLLQFYDRFARLIGRTCPDSPNEVLY